MNPTKRLTKTLLTASIIFAIGTGSAFADNEAEKIKTYTDPVSGELVVAPKLLSEMTPSEQATLTLDEKKRLEDIEKLVKKEAEMRKQGTNQ